MSSEYYDELHKKLGANKLGKDEQKELLEKFKEHGGQVVKAPGQETPGSTKNRAKGSSSDRHSGSAKSKHGAKTKTSHSDEENKKQQEEKKKRKKPQGTGLFDRLSLYLNSLTSGVTTFSGGMFKQKFIDNINNRLNSELVTLNGIVNSIVNPKTGNTKLIKGMLIQNDVYLYELLRLLTQLYQPTDFELMAKKTSGFSSSVDFMLVEEPLKKIYRRLYHFWPYTLRIKNAIMMGLGVHKEYNKLSEQDYEEKMSQGLQAVRFIFEEFFERPLHYAFCKLQKQYILAHDHDTIKEVLQINENETVEYLIQEVLKKRMVSKKSGKEDLEEETDGEERSEVQEEEEVVQELPAQLENGKRWIEGLNYSRDNATEKDPKYYFDNNDKIFRVYIVLEEFEKEFSFILTSNKIRFNVDWYENKKMDPKKELSDLYLGINACHDNIKDYVEIIKNIYKAENDHAMSISHKNEVLSKLNINKTRLSNITRTRLLDICRSLEKIMHWAAERKEVIIQNADDILHFDTFDGKKKVEGNSQVQIISLCSSFVGYLRYLLEFGELGGSGPIIENFS